MGIFSKITKKRTRTKRRPKTLKDILNDAYLSSLKKDPELLKEIAFRDAGHADILDRDREVETTKKQIKKHVTEQALNRIQSDPELAEQFISDQVEDIMSNGKPSRRRTREPEYHDYGTGYGSSIEQALSEIDSLSELKTKLSELGLIEGGDKGQGFFKGVTLKDIMEFLPHLTGKGADNGSTQQSEPRFVIEIDGKPTAVTESQYNKMLNQGKVRPVARLTTREEPEKPSTQSEDSEPSDKEDPGIMPISSGTSSTPEKTETPEPAKYEMSPQVEQYSEVLRGIDVKGILSEIDMNEIMEHFESEPSKFVQLLEQGKDSGDEVSNFLWGFFSNVDYNGVINLLEPYKEEPKVQHLLEKISSDEGKVWLEQVISLIQEIIEWEKKN